MPCPLVDDSKLVDPEGRAVVVSLPLDHFTHDTVTVMVSVLFVQHLVNHFGGPRQGSSIRRLPA